MKSLKLFVVPAIFALILFASCCTNNLRDFQQVQQSFEQISPESFVTIETSVRYVHCADDWCTKTMIDVTEEINGSGFITSNEQGIFVLTADHVCTPTTETMAVFSATQKLFGKAVVRIEIEREIIFNNGMMVIAKMTKNDSLNDICKLESEGIIGKPLKISPVNSSFGSEIHNISSPLGIKNFITDGKFSETIFRFGAEMDKYSMPVQVGSSGSAVLNENWEVIGIVTQKEPGFEHISYGPSYQTLFRFLNLP